MEETDQEERKQLVKIYIAMICDRHTDPELHLFSTPEAAIAFARKYYTDSLPDGLDQDEMEDAGIGEQETEAFLYNAVYSVEGDAVWVLVKELDGTAVMS